MRMLVLSPNANYQPLPARAVYLADVRVGRYTAKVPFLAGSVYAGHDGGPMLAHLSVRRFLY